MEMFLWVSRGDSCSSIALLCLCIGFSPCPNAYPYLPNKLIDSSSDSLSHPWRERLLFTSLTSHHEKGRITETNTAHQRSRKITRFLTSCRHTLSLQLANRTGAQAETIKPCVHYPGANEHPTGADVIREHSCQSKPYGPEAVSSQLINAADTA